MRKTGVLFSILILSLVISLPSIAKAQRSAAMSLSSINLSTGSGEYLIDDEIGEFSTELPKTIVEPFQVKPPTDLDLPVSPLWDNGPFVNCPGCGVGGADESVLQNESLGMVALGYYDGANVGWWAAEDFTVPDGQEWYIGTVTLYAYQTDSSITSTMDTLHLRIWDGPPGESGSNVLFGDTDTNRLASTGWTNAYRVNETVSGENVRRPIMYLVGQVDALFPEGQYWLDWQTEGTIDDAGSWLPPITINGEDTTGDGLRSTDGAVYFEATDVSSDGESGSKTPQGFPFLIHGSRTSISLDMTVAFSGDTCPGVNALTVSPGDYVKYCYEVTNTGNVTLNFHDLDDSNLGTFLIALPHLLNPGDKYIIETGSIQINQPTFSTATWTSYNTGPVDIVYSTDGLLVKLDSWMDIWLPVILKTP